MRVVYFFLLPVAIRFFYSLGRDINVDLLPDVKAYLDFVMMLILAFGLCFQLPVILTLLGQIGILSYEQLKKGPEPLFVGVFIVAAVLTPPDPISQIAMAVPLIAASYELSVQAVRIIDYRRKRREAAEEAAENSSARSLPGGLLASYRRAERDLTTCTTLRRSAIIRTRSTRGLGGADWRPCPPRC